MSAGHRNMTAMKYLLAVIIIAFSLFFSFQVSAQEIKVIKALQLFNLIEKCETGEEICIYNFWATWCAPCIRELPYFEAVSKNNRSVDVNLVGLDAVEDLDDRVKPFLDKKSIISIVWLLDETDFNAIIPKVNEQWSGAIPATLFVTKCGEKYFFEKEFKEGELEETIDKILSVSN